MATINGTSGNDTLISTASGDILQGAAGNDTYVVDDFADTVVETLPGNGSMSTHGDIVAATLTPAGVTADSASYGSALSADGSRLVFTSIASNLVAGDTNGYSDIFVRTLAAGQTIRVSTSLSGVQGNSDSGGDRMPVFFSPDGSKVFFSSAAANLVANDTNNALDLFMKDLNTGVVSRVNTGNAGQESQGTVQDAAISPDGQWLAFASLADDLVAGATSGGWKVFVKNLQSGAVRYIADMDKTITDVFSMAFSPDSSNLFFSSHVSNLVADDTNNEEDIFRVSLQDGAITRVSLDIINDITIITLPTTQGICTFKAVQNVFTNIACDLII